MPLLYFDTSGLMKRYVREVGSNRVDALLIQATPAISSIGRVEMASALARRVRERTMTVERRDEIYAQFLSDLSAAILVVPDEALLARASELPWISPPDAPLRALDAIHLASALTVFEEFPAETGDRGTIVTADRQLQREAEHAGLSVIDPEAQDHDRSGC